MAIILDGKKLSERILEDIGKKIKKSGKKLRIAGVLVGEDESSLIFLSKKAKACRKVGIGFNLFQFPRNIGQDALLKEIKKIALNSKNTGVIIQLPLPKRINAQRVLNLIPPEKDIDLLSEKSFSAFAAGKSLILPPVLRGILEILKEYDIKIKGKKIVIVGGGRLVGRPIAVWLDNHRIEAKVISSPTKNLSRLTRGADILITGTGKPGLIKGDMVKRGVVIIDAGTSKKKGRLAGDIEFKTVSEKASFITPVPGGLGPMTVAMVIQNLITLNRIK